ncbi:MAG: prolipoprotein diacylglyceryl transferase [Planctomycetota bacterium]|nr:prolipoprotein diacylglyceryl transferase [Planctomycetota bacterium]
MRSRLLEIPIPFIGASIPIFSYGLMIMIAYLTGTWSALRRARGSIFSRDDILDYSLYAVLAGVAGARLAHVAMFRDAFFYRYDPRLGEDVFDASRLWDIPKIWEGGLVFYGGLIAAIAVLVVFARRRKLPVIGFCDLCAPTVALGLAFGRIGCFLNGCCFGKPSDLPWAVSFPPGSPAFFQHLHEGLIPAAAEGSLHIHPTQLYESLGAFLLWLVLEATYRRRRFDGQTTAMFFLLYAPGRFLVELMRDDVGPGLPALNGWMTTAQYVSVLLAAAGAASYLYFRRAGAHVFVAGAGGGPSGTGNVGPGADAHRSEGAGRVIEGDRAGGSSGDGYRGAGGGPADDEPAQDGGKK